LHCSVVYKYEPPQSLNPRLDEVGDDTALRIVK
jgi:hypothetical protein